MEASEQAVPTVDASDPSKQRSRRILRKAQVREIDGLSDTSRWRKVHDGTYPAPIQLGANSIGFYEDEIRDWVASRPRVNYAPALEKSDFANDGAEQVDAADDGTGAREAAGVP